VTRAFLRHEGADSRQEAILRHEGLNLATTVLTDCRPLENAFGTIRTLPLIPLSLYLALDLRVGLHVLCTARSLRLGRVDGDKTVLRLALWAGVNPLCSGPNQIQDAGNNQEEEEDNEETAV